MTEDALTLFTGIGGFDLAFERAGINIAAQCEIEPHCQELLAKRFSGVPLFDDVKGIRGKDYEGIDIICGGFPCQDVSVAGRRAGLDGDRSGLWFEFRRIIAEARPRTVVVENVPGLLTFNRGGDFGTILGSLADLGYGFAYRVLDAQFFGVPQRRRRVFIVGCFGDAVRPCEILLEPEGGERDLVEGDAPREIASALTANGLGGGGPDDNLAQAHHLVPDVFQCHGSNVGPMGTLRAGNGAVTGGVPFTAVPFRKMRRPTALEDDPETWQEATHANTLDANGNVTRTAHAVVCDDDLGVRKLMPIECERLQGFPDNWTEGFADTHRYRMLGNAVAVPVVEWIAQRIVA